jgi:hypothetical protein
VKLTVETDEDGFALWGMYPHNAYDLFFFAGCNHMCQSGVDDLCCICYEKKVTRDVSLCDLCMAYQDSL